MGSRGLGYLRASVGSGRGRVVVSEREQPGILDRAGVVAQAGLAERGDDLGERAILHPPHDLAGTENVAQLAAGLGGERLGVRALGVREIGPEVAAADGVQAGEERDVLALPTMRAIEVDRGVVTDGAN